jgi:SDR family mycofactocin-dependent oxidoreductase
MGKFDGKVVFVTGGARGQGRSHALHFADEGADVITLDICGQIPSVAAPMPTREDLEETARLVEKAGRRAIARTADVRDFAAVQGVVDEGLSEFGRIDFVLANAGIFPVSIESGAEPRAFYDAIDVMVNGVFHTCEAAIPSMIAAGRGGAIIITSSTAGLRAFAPTREYAIPGMLGYTTAKHGVVGLMRSYANALGPHGIRCNTVHPSGVNTPMIVNDPFQRYMASRTDVAVQFSSPLGVGLLEASDISKTMVFLCSEEGQYITGATVPVDAGVTAKS